MPGTYLTVSAKMKEGVLRTNITTSRVREGKGKRRGGEGKGKREGISQRVGQKNKGEKGMGLQELWAGSLWCAFGTSWDRRYRHALTDLRQWKRGDLQSFGGIRMGRRQELGQGRMLEYGQSLAGVGWCGPEWEAGWCCDTQHTFLHGSFALVTWLP